MIILGLSVLWPSSHPPCDFTLSTRPLPPAAPEDPPSERGAGRSLHGGRGGPGALHSAPLQPQSGGPHHHPGLPPPGSSAGPGPVPAR